MFSRCAGNGPGNAFRLTQRGWNTTRPDQHQRRDVNLVQSPIRGWIKPVRLAASPEWMRTSTGTAPANS